MKKKAVGGERRWLVTEGKELLRLRVTTRNSPFGPARRFSRIQISPSDQINLFGSSKNPHKHIHTHKKIICEKRRRSVCKKTNIHEIEKWEIQ